MTWIRRRRQPGQKVVVLSTIPRATCAGAPATRRGCVFDKSTDGGVVGVPKPGGAADGGSRRAETHPAPDFSRSPIAGANRLGAKAPAESRIGCAIRRMCELTPGHDQVRCRAGLDTLRFSVRRVRSVPHRRAQITEARLSSSSVRVAVAVEEHAHARRRLSTSRGATRDLAIRPRKLRCA